MKSETLYEHNFRSLAARFPIVAARLDRLRRQAVNSQRDGPGTTDDIEIMEAAIGGGKTARCLHCGVLVHSRVDPLAEARRIARQILNTDSRRFLIFGFGLGYHIQEILAASGEVEEVTVFGFNPALLTAAMRAVDLTGLIGDSRMSLHLPCSAEEFAAEIMELQHVNYRHFYHRPSLRIAPASMQEAVDIVEGLSVEQMNADRRMHEMEENRERNRAAVAAARGVETLFGRGRGKGAVVVAAGPSLDTTMSHLHNLNGNAAVIAVNAIFRKLMASGIRPHAVVCIESRPEITADFEGLWEGDVPLIFLPTTQYRVVARYGGPKIVAYPEGDLATDALARDFPKGRLASGLGSAAGSAIDLAIKMDANPIIFTGLDLAFTGRRSYCDDVKADESLRAAGGPFTRKVPAVGGGLVRTSPAFYHALQAIERLIIEEKQRCLDRIFIDATGGGARIDGSRIMPLEEISAALGREAG